MVPLVHLDTSNTNKMNTTSKTSNASDASDAPEKRKTPQKRRESTKGKLGQTSSFKRESTFKRELGEARKRGRKDSEVLKSLFKKLKAEGDCDAAKACMLMSLAETDLNIVYRTYELLQPEQRTEASYTLLIKSLCDSSEVESAMHFLREMCDIMEPHVRTFVPFFSAQYTDEYKDNELAHADAMPLNRFQCLLQAMRHYKLVPTLELFTLIFGCIPSTLSKVEIQNLLDWVSQYYTYVPEALAINLGKSLKNISAGVNQVKIQHSTNVPNGPSRSIAICLQCKEQLPLLTVESSQRKTMRKALKFAGKTDIRGFLKKQSFDFDVVVDGANVAMFNNSPFRADKVEKVIKKVGATKKILVVFHISRKKQVKDLLEKAKNKSNVSANATNNVSANVTFFFSKQNEDDDNTWLYATLKGKKTVCITADKMTDHLYYRFKDTIGKDVFDKWCECHIASYRFGRNFEGEVEIYWPLPYSPRVSYSDNHIHVPYQPANASGAPNGPNGTSVVIWHCIKY